MASGFRGRTIGGYRLTERLGQGGMGVVYKAVDTALDREVAIKMMVPAGDDQREETSARFLVEAKAAARIQSRHVAQVLQLGQTDEGEVYIVMELLVGQPLSKLVKEHTRLEPLRAVRIARHIAKGMQSAHALGIVHRDLKPANVMLVNLDGEQEVAKILDFGVAKLTRDSDQANLTQTGAMLGTLPYMAPEQILGKAVDARTDVYALGVVLYRMLTGHPLYDSESLSDVVRHQVHTAPPPMSKRAPGLSFPPSLEAVVAKCLAKDPAGRYASMVDVDVALKEAVNDLTEDLPSAQRKAIVQETLPTGTRLDAATGDVAAPAAQATLVARRGSRDASGPADRPARHVAAGAFEETGALVGADLSLQATLTRHKAAELSRNEADASIVSTAPAHAIWDVGATQVPEPTDGRRIGLGLVVLVLVLAIGAGVLLAFLLRRPTAPAVVERTPVVVPSVPAAVVEPTAVEPPTPEPPVGVEPVAEADPIPVVEVKLPDEPVATNASKVVRRPKPVKKTDPKAKVPPTEKSPEKTPVETKPKEDPTGGFKRVLTKDPT